MNRYEALFIFQDTLKDNTLEEAISRAKAEIKKADGEVDSTTRLGKRAFARRMQKKEGGQYVLITFKAAGDRIKPMIAKFKLNEDVFRVQVVRGSDRPPKPVADKAEEEKKDGRS